MILGLPSNGNAPPNPLGAIAFLPIPNNPASQGGPTRRDSNGGAFVISPTVTQVRTAPAGVPDPWPGAGPPPRQDVAFLPDGRLVPKSSFPAGTFQGALGATDDDPDSALRGFMLASILSGILVGTVFGAVLSKRQRAGRAMDTAIGAGLGAVAGFGAAIIAGRAAVLTTKL